MPDGCHLLLPPNERGGLNRQVVGMRVEGPQRREVGGQVRDHDLEETCGTLEVFEAMRSQIAQPHLGWEFMLDQLVRGL